MGDLKSMNPQMRALRPGEQIPVTPEMMKNAVEKKCPACGCTYFMQAVTVCVISALLSPIGKELTYPQPVLVCMECKKALK